MQQLSLNPRIIAMVLTAVFSVAFSIAPALADEPPVIEINRAEAANPERQSSLAPKAVFSPEKAGAIAQSQLSPMMLDIQTVVEQGRVQALELESRAAMAADEESILAIQRQIEELAQETELEILRVQARHARLDGREEIAARIEQDIADIMNPPVVRARLDRPERSELDNQ